MKSSVIIGSLCVKNRTQDLCIRSRIVSHYFEMFDMVRFICAWKLIALCTERVLTESVWKVPMKVSLLHRPYHFCYTQQTLLLL
jgi:hypothetical protein